MPGSISTIILDDTIKLDFLRKEVYKTLDIISELVKEDDFFVVETKSINGSIENTTARPFIMTVGEINGYDFEYTEEELEEIKQTFHQNFKNSINIAAMCNQKIDQRILGELTLFFAEKFNAIIDIFGVDPKLDSDKIWNVGNTTLVHPAYFKIWLEHEKFFMIK